MGISRRQFLLSTAGAAVGAIIPSFYFRALEYLERHEEPLLEMPGRAGETLVVSSGEDYDLQLTLGDPHDEPPDMSHAEYAELIGYDVREYLQEFGLREKELSLPIDWETRLEVWANHDGPNARAWYLLDTLDLGRTLRGRDAVGGIDLWEDSNIAGWHWKVATARDEISLGLLQKRLNDLDTGIRIVLGYAV